MTDSEKDLQQQEISTPEAAETQNVAETPSQQPAVTSETPVSEAVSAEADADDVTVLPDVPTEVEVQQKDEEEIAEVKDLHSMTKEEIIAELKRIVAEKEVNSHKEVAGLKQALFALRQKEVEDELNAWVEAGNSPEGFSSEPDAAENEAKELMSEFKEMRTAYLEAEEKRLEENLAKKHEIVAQMEKIVEDADNVNQHFTEFQNLQKAFKEIKEVTPSGEAGIWKKFQNIGEKFYDTLKINKELRDLDFKKNLEAKRRLIAEAVALQTEEGVVEALRKLRILNDEWREIGPVVKELRDSIWEEFREASTIIYKRHQEYFDRRKEEEAANEAAKNALCDEIEAVDLTSLNTFPAWEEATEKVKEIQAKWRTIGFASRKANNEVYRRFRKACDDFFEAKSNFRNEVRSNQQANYDKKVALCEKAEALQASEDLKASLDAAVKLQEEWKTIGPVPHKLSDAIWERFTTACRQVFARRRKEMDARHNEEMANLEKKREVIAALKEIPHDIERNEGLRQVRTLQAQWNEIGFVPFQQKDKVYKQYREACDAIYDALNANREKERRRNFEGQLENIKGDARKMRSERDRLFRVLEGKLQDLKTYKNNLGFFNVKSASGNSMLKEMERKMARLESDIDDIRKKISMIDESGNEA